MYLQLLTAQWNPNFPGNLGDEEEVRQSFAELEEELGRSDISGSLWESKAATLEILNKRLKNIQRREQYNQEIESNL